MGSPFFLKKFFRRLSKRIMCYENEYMCAFDDSTSISTHQIASRASQKCGKIDHIVEYNICVKYGVRLKNIRFKRVCVYIIHIWLFFFWLVNTKNNIFTIFKKIYVCVICMFKCLGYIFVLAFWIVFFGYYSG